MSTREDLERRMALAWHNYFSALESGTVEELDALYANYHEKYLDYFMATREGEPYRLMGYKSHPRVESEQEYILVCVDCHTPMQLEPPVIGMATCPTCGGIISKAVPE